MDKNYFDGHDIDFQKQADWFNQATEPSYGEDRLLPHISELIRGLRLVQSPIEAAMLKAMAATWWDMPLTWAFFQEDPETEVEFGFNWYGPSDVRVVAPQKEFGRYRADFAVWRLYMTETAPNHPMRWVGPVIVECDGHDFHERSKKQAAHDKRRDRWFSLQGMTVLRFTGSEIHADPTECVSQIDQHFCQEAMRHHG